MSYSDFDNDKIIISISDPNKVNPEFNINNNSIKDILYLSFYDISEETKSIFGGYESMSPIDAILIRDFILKWQDEIDTIWVQCEMGMSRSAGIAAAIMEYFDMDSNEILEGNQYYPNRLCYNLTKGAFNKLNLAGRGIMTYTRFQVPIFHNTQNTLYSEDNKLRQISFADSCVDMFLCCGDKSLEIGMKISGIKTLLNISWINDIENITDFDFSEKIVFDFDTGETNACLFNNETLVQSKNIYEIIDEDSEDMLCKIISKNNHVKEKLKNAFTKNYNISVPFPLNELNLKYFALMTQYQGYNKEFYYSIPFDDRKTITHFTFNDISKELKNGNNAMNLLNKYNIPHKKSIRRIFAERQGLFFYLKECGIMYNVINNIDLFSSFLNDKFCYYILSYLHTYPALENYFKDFVKYTNIVSFCNKIKKNLSFLSYAFEYNSLRSDMKQEKIKCINKQHYKYEAYPCITIPFSIKLINTIDVEIKIIDGYEFIPLKNTSDCHIAGKQLSNSLKNWEYFYEPVVIVRNYKKTIAAIEFSDNHLRSAYKAYHCPVSTDIPLCSALKKWCVESGIDYQGYFEYIQGYED